jgi:hypothetical protein
MLYASLRQLGVISTYAMLFIQSRQRIRYEKIQPEVTPCCRQQEIDSKRKKTTPLSVAE